MAVADAPAAGIAEKAVRKKPDKLTGIMDLTMPVKRTVSIQKGEKYGNNT